jgi:DNA-binding MurR/RpiR family transcriptional regulator
MAKTRHSTTDDQHLSPLHRAILNFIIKYKAEPANDGNSPSYEDIATGLGTYKSNIYRACRKLQKRGLLKINQHGKLIIPGGQYQPPRNKGGS